MNIRTLHYAVLLLIILATSCQKQPDYLEEALQFAGTNRPELEKVLTHYSVHPADSLKYRAAVFLIKNMSYHYTLVSSRLELLDSIFYNELSLQKEVGYKYSDPYINGKIRRTQVEKIWENLIKIHENPSTYPTEKIVDNRIIKADLLIENIDYALKAYQLPWASHLSFNDFCEYVLPYRFGDEKLESWRPYFMERYQWIVDSLQDKSDPVEACKLINDDISKWFQFDGMFNSYPRVFRPSLLLKTGIGSCQNQAAIASFAMRSVGLAIAHNNIPHWGDRSKGHDFSSVLSKENRFVDFLGGELAPGKNEIRNKATKIYQKTFSDKIDVTDKFVVTSTVTVEISGNKASNQKTAYLCVFNNKEWIPVAMGEIKRGKISFEKTGRDIVYLPVIWTNSGYQPIDSPFLLTKEGEKRLFTPDVSNQREVTLSRKYPRSASMIQYANHTIGGKFQGANRPNFSDAVDLYEITSTPDSYFKSYPVKKQKFRYLRYLFPPVSIDSAGGNVAEIGFTGKRNENTETVLTGTYIGNEEITKKQFEILFDKKLDNYVTINIADTITDFYPDRTITIPFIKPVWVGLDLKEEVEITAVVFCPRNDTNNIYEHCIYELFYWQDKWISLGQKNSSDHCLIYNNVPANALLLLHNHTEGTEERIFSYENDKQLFW